MKNISLNYKNSYLKKFRLSWNQEEKGQLRITSYFYVNEFHDLPLNFGLLFHNSFHCLGKKYAINLDN